MGYQKINKAAIVLIVSILGFVFYASHMNDGTLPEQKIRVGKSELVVEVAQTSSEQAKGLSGRSYLASDRGMLFIYPEKKILNFWMKDMKFALDMIWVADNIVIGLEENIAPLAADGSIARFESPTPVDMALEVNAGWVKANGIEIGNKFEANIR